MCRNDYYGGMWASFNFDALQKWLDECRKPSTKKVEISDDKELVKQGETMIVSGDQFSTVLNIEEEWLIPEYVLQYFLNFTLSIQITQFRFLLAEISQKKTNEI